LPPIVLTNNNPGLNLLAVRGSFAFAALFYALAALPTFLYVKERHKGRTLPEGETYITIAFKRLGSTLRAVRHFREFIKFIIAFLVYNDGILMALDFAAIIGAVLFGMTQTQLILFMILVQITSAIGAYTLGLLGEKIGFKRSLLLSLLLMIASVAAMIVNPSLVGYFVIGGVAGFALTGVQSISRTMIGLFAPESKTAEFFSFFAVAGKSSSFIGPATFGLIVAGIAGFFEKRGLDLTLAEQYGTRAGLSTIAIFLLVGLAILLSVNERRARQAAEEFTPAAD